MTMIKHRYDMSEWAIHFVHRRNPDYAPDAKLLASYDGRVPFHSDSTRDATFRDWHDRDAQHGLADKAPGISVLSKIIDDGHIRAGWSFRGGKPTIYGPRPACCFTEMPLSSFLTYARTRNSAKSVDTYAICVLKTELFQAGGRPVIYGTSVRHNEQDGNGLPRLLTEDCGIGEREQFRYVAFNLARSIGRIDWTHEREWRWCDVHDTCGIPGLPVWTSDPQIAFTRIILVVKAKEEVEGILNQLKQRHDSGTNPFGDPYRIEALRNTSVVAIEELPESENVRIEDIPEHQIAFQKPSPSDEYSRVVAEALAEARRAGLAAAQVHAPVIGRFVGLLTSRRGAAYGMVFDPQSELTEALIALNAVTVKSWGGYRLNLFEEDESLLPTIDVSVAAVEAALKVLEEKFQSAVFWWSIEEHAP